MTNYDDWKLRSPYDESPSWLDEASERTVTMHWGDYSPPQGHPAPADAEVEWEAAPGDSTATAWALDDKGNRVGPSWVLPLCREAQDACSYEAETQAQDEAMARAEDAAELRAEMARER